MKVSIDMTLTKKDLESLIKTAERLKKNKKRGINYDISSCRS